MVNVNNKIQHTILNVGQGAKANWWNIMFTQFAIKLQCRTTHQT
jgi:hypothetical protein